MSFNPLRACRLLTGLSILFVVGLFCFVNLPFADEGDTKPAALVQKLQQTLAKLRETKKERYALAEKVKQHRALLEEEMDSLNAEKEEILLRRDSLKKENSALQKEKEGLAKKLGESSAELARVSAAVKATAEKLREKIERGLPYKTDDRKKVVDNFLESAGKDVASDVALLWQIVMQELELGFSSESYPGAVKLPDGRIKDGEYLRIGRLVLAYITDDGLDCGLVARRSGRFALLAELDSSQREAISESFQIMRRMRSPSLVVFPVHASVTGKEGGK